MISFHLIFLQENGSREIEINDIYKIDPRDDRIQTVSYGRWAPEKGIVWARPWWQLLMLDTRAAGERSQNAVF